MPTSCYQFWLHVNIFVYLLYIHVSRQQSHMACCLVTFPFKPPFIEDFPARFDDTGGWYHIKLISSWLYIYICNMYIYIYKCNICTYIYICVYMHIYVKIVCIYIYIHSFPYIYIYWWNLPLKMYQPLISQIHVYIYILVCLKMDYLSIMVVIIGKNNDKPVDSLFSDNPPKDPPKTVKVLYFVI